MGKCKKCNVEILDNTNECPLCFCVVEKSEDKEEIYPDIRVKTKKLFLATRIYLFVAIIVQVALFYINYVNYNEVWWSVYTFLIFGYIYMLLRYVFLHTSGYRTKIFVVITLALVCAYLIDLFSGYRGWSIGLVLPIGEMIFTVIILLLLIINNKSWQSYILLQIFNIVICVIHFVLGRLDLINYNIVSLIALFMAIALFLGTVIIGGDKAKEELKRRFMI